MRPALFASLLLIFVSAPMTADCPCIPITHLWVVKTCGDWNCASTELTLASGDPQVIAVPVGIDDSRWLVVRRFAAGAAIDVTDDSFELKQFDGMDGAVAHYSLMPRERHPMLMTAPDGQVLVIAMKQPEPRRRAISR
ncbi:MAG: hypothetical protein QOE68_583 [Thermoanaerobaculia bacterium]|jgi:hypothetical protein|nr:hypothetical protein [Thermoanaerobaculia bacterium]